MLISRYKNCTQLSIYSNEKSCTIISFFRNHISKLFGVLGLNVDGDAEDGTCVNQTLGEDAKDGLVDLAGGRYDESCDGEGEAAEEHGNCGAVLDGFFGGGLHFFNV